VEVLRSTSVAFAPGSTKFPSGMRAHRRLARLQMDLSGSGVSRPPTSAKDLRGWCFLFLCGSFPWPFGCPSGRFGCPRVLLLELHLRANSLSQTVPYSALPSLARSQIAGQVVIPLLQRHPFCNRFDRLYAASLDRTLPATGRHGAKACAFSESVSVAVLGRHCRFRERLGGVRYRFRLGVERGRRQARVDGD
jgi:hypothetical protein